MTATNAFYARGHGPVPELDRHAWRLRVDRLVERTLSLSLETLQEAFVERTLTATLQCAGNRREGLIAVRDIPGEAPWGRARPAPRRGPGSRWLMFSRSPDRSTMPYTWALKVLT